MVFFATPFMTIQAEHICRQIDEAYARERCWPEPLIQISRSLRRSATVETLVLERSGLASASGLPTRARWPAVTSGLPEFGGGAQFYRRITLCYSTLVAVV